jgi:trigger factor
MQVSVETGEGLERRMRVDLPLDRVQVEVDKRLQQLARGARIPGFRPGKVPMKVLRQRYGGQIEREVFGDMVQSSYSDAVSGQGLHPAGVPRIEPDLDLAAGRFAFTATFEVLPQFELAPLTDAVIKRPVAQIEDTDLEQVIERLREQRKTWVPVERPAQGGDRLTVSYTATLDGAPFEGGSASGTTLELGSGRMIPGFEDALLGAGAGEQRALDLTFPADYQRGDLAGRPVHFEVTVEAVSEPLLPAVDAEFARAFGVADGDLERLRADVRASMERELKQRVNDRMKEAVMDLLVRSNPLDIPGVLLANEIRTLQEHMRDNLGNPKLELPDALFAEQARRRVTLGLIVAEIVQRNGIKADPAQVRAAVEDLAATYEHPQAVVDHYYADRQRLAPVESLVLEEQVVDWVLGQVSVKDEPLSFAQLTDPAAAGMPSR